MALDDVAGLYLVGEDDGLVADGTACRLHLADRPDAVRLDRAECAPGAVRTSEHLVAADPRRDLDLLTSAWTPHRPHRGTLRRETQKSLEPPAVEPDDDLAVDLRHWRSPVSHLDQLVAGRGILADVFDREIDALLRKKLFLVVAARSARLGIDDHRFRH